LVKQVTKKIKHDKYVNKKLLTYTTLTKQFKLFPIFFGDSS